jgi:hypothetical protein
LHAAPLAVAAVVGIVVLWGVAVFDADADAEGVVGAVLPFEDPGRRKIKATMTITARAPRPTISRRRQYTLLGWGPTGCLIVDMPSG